MQFDGVLSIFSFRELPKTSLKEEPQTHLRCCITFCDAERQKGAAKCGDCPKLLSIRGPKFGFPL